MKQAMGALVLFSLVAGLPAADTNNIRGKVIFSGRPPITQPLRIAGDEFCERVHGENPITRENLVINPNRTLKNVVVWVEGGWPDDKAPENTNPGKMRMALTKCEIQPHVIAIQTDKPLEIVNEDDTVHNVNSRPSNNQNLNHTLPPGSSPVTWKFSQSEVAVNLRSDIHPWMTAWVAVFDHPAFAVTGDDGNFEIPGLPVGEYRLAAWHENFGMITTDVLLQRDVVAEVEFTFTTTGAKSATQTNSFSTARRTTGTINTAVKTTSTAR